MENKFESLAVALPPGPQDQADRHLTATWTRGAATFEARLARRGNLPVSESISVSQPGGVTGTARRLPSDVDLIAAISRLGPEATALLLWLMGESLWVEELPSAAEELIQERLVRFATDLGRRTRSDRLDLVEKAAGMLAEGARTTDIVTYLCTAGGVSRATAYRILSRAEGSRVHE